MNGNIKHKHTIDLGNGNSIEIIVGERGQVRAQTVGSDIGKDVVIGPGGVDALYPSPKPDPRYHGVDPKAWGPSPWNSAPMAHHVHEDDGGIRWTDDWPDGKPPKNLPPIPIFGRARFSEVDYSGADCHRVGSAHHPYGAFWRRYHIGDPVVFKPKKGAGVPKAKHDDELQPVKVRPADVARAFEAGLPGRKVGFGFNPARDASIRILLVDGWYLALTESKWARVLASHPARNKYVAERYDCDDFAKWFAAWVSHEYEINGCAWVLSGSDGHSYNAIMVIGDDGKSLHMQLVEPQADAEVPVDPKEHHGLMAGDVII